MFFTEAQPIIPVTIEGTKGNILDALMDTGATECYIDFQASSKFADVTQKHSKPVDLRLFDGSMSSAGPISSYVDLPLLMSTSQDPIPTRFNITKLQGADIVLGSRWMSQHHVLIDLAKRSITFNKQNSNLRAPMSTNLGGLWSAKRNRRHLIQRTSTYPNNIPILSPKFGFDQSRTTTQTPASRITSLFDKGQPSSSCPTTLFGVTREIQNEDLNELSEFKATQPQFVEPQAEADYLAETIELQNQVPQEYHDYFDIFRAKAGMETLPPHREYDMHIDLVPSAKLAPAKLYQLTEVERQTLLDTLKRETTAGRIRPSNAAFGSPMFFVPKKDGRLRMVVDYRHLNSNTINDSYPLPLINQITNELAKARFFTKLDLVGAYQLLRVKEGFEHLTAFRTQYGMYESLVVRDGLRNAPAVFQHFLNEVFRDVIGRGVTVYIDDILIYSDTLEELRRLTRKVFELCRKASLYLKASKCEFEKNSLLFLGFIISNNGVSTDPDKVKAVQEFPTPKNLTESRSFIGLVSYYRRFVTGFSKIAAPITDLTKKGCAFEWNQPQQSAFQQLKDVLSSAPVLSHYNPSYNTIVQTDASFFGWGFIISQINSETQQEHPVSIESGRFTGAQLRYTTSEKEFLAIVYAFTRSRHMLIQVPTTVVTDHLNLTYWMKPRELNPRQARWVEALAGYRMRIVYRPGRQAEMPDALSRRSDYHTGKGTTFQANQEPIQALPNFDEYRGGTHETLHALQDSTLRHVDEYYINPYDLIKGQDTDTDIKKLRDEMLSVKCSKCDHPTCNSATPTYSSLDELRRKTRNPEVFEPRWTSLGLVAFGRRLYIPNFKDARLKVLRSRHDSTLAGHPGISKTTELVLRNYTWINLRQDVTEYVTGCATCQRTKTSRTQPHGFLRTLEVPQLPWEHISMDFIEPLPLSNGYDSILVVVDRLTKMSTFLPTTSTLTSTKLAEILIREIFTRHGLPRSIVSDRGSKFIAKFWRCATEKLGIKLKLSTAFHPQTDGQTERVNQSVEQYLRIFTSYNQDDWSEILGQAAFAYNNTYHSAIKLTPFYANFGYHPRWVDEILPNGEGEVPLARQVVEDLHAVHEQCQKNIEIANQHYAKYYDKHRKPSPTIKVGDQVMLSFENIKTQRPSKKLDVKRQGPFFVTEQVGSHAYRLQLPNTMKNHDVFHVSLLEPYRAPTYPNQTTQPPGPVRVNGNNEYEVANIINSRNNSRTGRLEFLVEWLGYEGTDEHTSWEPKSNLTSSKTKLKQFHERYPGKPSKNLGFVRR